MSLALLVGVRPALAPVTWVTVVLVAVVGLLSETLNLPQWVRDISPLQHVPALPAAEFELLPIAILSALAVALLALATFAFERRDVD